MNSQNKKGKTLLFCTRQVTLSCCHCREMKTSGQSSGMTYSLWRTLFRIRTGAPFIAKQAPAASYSWPWLQTLFMSQPRFSRLISWLLWLSLLLWLMCVYSFSLFQWAWGFLCGLLCRSLLQPASILSGWFANPLALQLLDFTPSC